MEITKNKEIKIQLTDNTLENIKIMAPLLDEASQNQVYGLMIGIISGIGKEESKPQKAG